MTPRSTASATIAAMIAFSTNAAGPYWRSASKVDAITQSVACFGAALSSPLINAVYGDVLARRKLISQSPSVTLRSETSDLIHACEIFRSDCVHNVPGQVLHSPIR